MMAARIARRSIFGRSPAPTLSFVQEEVTLRRPVGGRMVWRRQLERLLELGQLWNVSIQVMPTDSEEHFGTGGLIEVLRFPDGTAVGRAEGAFNGRPVSDPKQLRIPDLRYGMIRAQSLTPPRVTCLHRANAWRNMIGTPAHRDTSALAWFKSGYSSSGDGNDCIEVATAPGLVHVRDSKNITGPQLVLAPEAWADFVTYASRG